MNRREFIKKSVIASTVTAGAVAVKPTVAMASDAKSVFTKQHKSIDDVLQI